MKTPPSFFCLATRCLLASLQAAEVRSGTWTEITVSAEVYGEMVKEILA